MASSTQARPRICFERIIPDEMDPEREVRRGMRERMAAKKKGRVSGADMRHLARMAVVNSKKWPNGSQLKCRFMDGSPKMRRNVEKYAHIWEKHCNITFKFVRTGAAEIRISFFADDGAWAGVGRDCLNERYFPRHQPNMNFGWFRDDTDLEEYQRTTLHEFGHALGCVHEHQQPKFDRKWDREAVLLYFQGPPNYWEPADIRANVLEKYSARSVSATRFDPKSIMLYDFDGELFTDNKGPTNSNSKLSAKDIAMIKKMYPR